LILILAKMTETNLALKISTLSKQMNNVTDELLSMKSSLTNIEDNIAEIKVRNGGGIEVKMKTNELLKNLYEQTKDGGIIDAKFKTCAENHSAQKRMGIFEKKSAVWFSVAYRGIITMVVFYMLMKMVQFEQVFTAIGHVTK
jgi:chorismate mutase